MRSSLISAVGIGAATLAIVAAYAPTASANGTSLGAAHQAATSSLVNAHPNAKTCYSQMDNDNGVGVVSQDFEASFDIYDTEAADDIKVTKDCTVKRITVAGTYFNGSGPARSIHAGGYLCKKGAPFGKTIYEQSGLKYTDASGTGNFTVKLKPPLKLKIRQGPCAFIGVVAEMDFSTGGEWGWNTNNTQRGNPSYWENPGDGFGTGCLEYTPTLTCVAASEGPDFAFQLN